MLDQLIIGEKASFDDFGASLAQITVKAPKKKTIKETVPFANVTYDFSAIDGELYWEERDIECIFEIIAPTPEDLERKKTAFSSWVMNVMQENIISPFDPDYHYIGTYDDMDYKDEESVEKTTATVKFTAYPYKIANVPKEYNFVISAATNETVIIVNDSSHRLTPTIITNAEIIIKLDNASYSIPAGEITDSIFKFETGVNTLTIQNVNNTECAVTVKFSEEVF